MTLKKVKPTADTWVMPKVRGLAGVLGSGLSMVAAGIGALIFVSVLLAFHGWPTNAAGGTAPRAIMVATTPVAPVAKLVIGRPASARTAAAANVAARTRTTPGQTHSAPSTRLPTFTDLSRPKPTAPAPKPKLPTVCGSGAGVAACPNITPATLPPVVTTLIDQGTHSANGLTQQVQDGLSNTGKTVGGVLNGVTSTLSKALGN